MSKLHENNAVTTVAFTNDVSLLPVSAEEVALIASQFGDLLQRMLMHCKED